MTYSPSEAKLSFFVSGFTVGFSILTVWEAMKQTRRNRRPWTSLYIYMIWGEIAANVGLFVLGWVYFATDIDPSIPVLFLFPFFWYFEVQLLLHIILNRIAIIADNRRTVRRLMWATAIAIGCIYGAVLVTFIPSQLLGAGNSIVLANDIWHRTSKGLILLIDAGLNYYFLRMVRVRLVRNHGLTKYAPLVSFNAKLMVLSILMDAMLLGLLSLPHELLHVQFHPAVYMVKLSIEMALANLITRLARGNDDTEACLASVSTAASASTWRRSADTADIEARAAMPSPHDDDDEVDLADLGLVGVVGGRHTNHKGIRVETVITATRSPSCAAVKP